MYALVLLFSVVPMGPETISTELVEVNHCYNRDTGDRRFVQVIYWDRADGRSLHVREWHMLEKCQSIYRVTERTHRPYTVLRQRNGRIQIIHSRRFKITHTFLDPEEIDRKFLPASARRPLDR